MKVRFEFIYNGLTIYISDYVYLDRIEYESLCYEISEKKPCIFYDVDEHGIFFQIMGRSYPIEFLEYTKITTI